jgi:hypothetical protein
MLLDLSVPALKARSIRVAARLRGLPAATGEDR